MVRVVSATLHRLCVEAEKAAHRGDLHSAVRNYIAAGDAARSRERWQLAARCYRSALEVDLGSRVAVSRLVHIGGHTNDRKFWVEYSRMLKHDGSWSQLTCRRAQILVHNLGSVIECAEVGPVIELVIASDGSFECLPDARFKAMPLAMTLIILRRALWPTGRSSPLAPRVRVGYRGHTVWLNARGEWYAA